jgi:type VI secretion system Hcp family effector
MKELSLAIILCFLPLAMILGQSNEIMVDESGINFGDGGVINGQTSTLTLPGTILNIYAEFSDGIEGDVTAGGYENLVQIYTIDHFQNRDVNPADGIPSTPRRNKYFSFRKPLDKASVDIADFYKTNSVITSITFNLLADDGTGLAVNRFDIVLEGVQIAEYWLDFDVKQDGTFQAVEKFLLSYSVFRFRDVVNNVGTNINWNF